MSDTGAVSCGTGADDSGVGSVAWSLPENITALDFEAATIISSTSSVISHYLKATNFGFTIPAGATIDGIVVEWNRSSLLSSSRRGTDYRSRIVKGGSIGATDKSVAGFWPSTPAYQSYGGASDLWGETWTYTDINDSTFGAVIAAIGESTGLRVGIDHCRITVYYTTASGTTYTRSLSENYGGSDSFSRLADAVRSITDGPGTSDTYARLADASRAYSDNLAGVEVFSRLSDALRALIDTGAGSDAFSRVADANRSTTDNFGAAENYDRLADALRSYSDAGGFLDAYDRLSDASRSHSDSLASSDDYARLADAVRAYQDLTACQDDAARVADAVRALLDLLGGTEAFDRLADALRAVEDTAGQADDVLRMADALRACQDSLGGMDDFARVADALRALPDWLGVDEEFAADLIVAVTAFDLALSESLGLTEEYGRISDAVRAVEDSLAVLDLAGLLLEVAALILYAEAGGLFAATAYPQGYAANLAGDLYAAQRCAAAGYTADPTGDLYTARADAREARQI